MLVLLGTLGVMRWHQLSGKLSVGFLLSLSPGRYCA